MEILTNFGIQPTLLVAQIVNFTIILVVLKIFFYKPIMKVLEDRRKRIEESLKNADLIEQKLATTEEKTQKIIEESRTNAQNIISDAKKEADRVYDLANTEARKLAEETISKASLQIEKQRDQMQKQVEKEALLLVTEVVKKVLGRTLKPQEKQDLTKQAISEIGKQVQ